jgi:ChrR-like protein with cupin domain
VSSGWRPDDSLLERDDKDEVRGVRRVKDALQKHGVRYGNRVITSRDKGMDAIRNDLKRTGMPPGVEQWQVPIVVKPSGDALSFTGRMEPGAEVPEHAHPHPVYRIVIEGSLEYGDLTLKPGDWMFVPAGLAYSITAGPDGCSTFYHHGSCQLMV